MFSPRDQVIVDFSYLNQGDTVSGQLCPQCRGGDHKEHSMSVGRSDGWLWWRCHRASCNFRGGHSEGRVTSRSGKKQEIGKLTYTTTDLTHSKLIPQLTERLHLSENLMRRARWEWTPEYEGRVVMPIFRFDGSRAGDLLRSYDPATDKKALINRLRDGELMCWYVNSIYPQTLVVVEDQPSALRISGVKGLAGLALLGTSLSEDRCSDIRSSGIKNVILCLDQDATAEAVRQVVHYRRALPMLKIIALDKDIKAMDTQEFESFLEQVEVITRR